MNIVFWIVIAAALFVVFELPRRFKDKELIEDNVLQEKPEPTPIPQVHFYGGPLHNEVHTVPTVKERNDFVIHPYVPEDEDGVPQLDPSMIMGTAPDGRAMIMPKFAYYQQIDDSNFFYVRDVTQKEAKILSSNKEWRPLPDNGEDPE